MSQSIIVLAVDASEILCSRLGNFSVRRFHIAVAEDTAGNSGATQSAATLPLKPLNSRSAKISAWDAAAFAAKIYDYTNLRGAQDNCVFRCLLTSLQDPSAYVRAEVKMKNGDKAPIVAATDKYKDGLRFRMSKVRFAAGKPEYISAPLQILVDLQTTKMDPLLNEAQAAPEPQPVTSVASCLELRQVQRFDLTALVSSVSNPRKGGAEPRKAVDVILIDGSQGNGKTQQLKVTLFYDAVLGADPMGDLRASASGADALTYSACKAKLSKASPWNLLGICSFAKPKATNQILSPKKRRRSTACQQTSEK